MEPEPNTDTVNINVIDLFEEEYDLEVELHCDSVVEYQKTPVVILLVECGSGLDLEVTKSLKYSLLKFVGDLRDAEIQKMFLAWNDKSYELTNRPFPEIREILEAQNSSAKKSELSYRASLQSIRHTLVNESPKLEAYSNVSLIFFSSHMEPCELLVEGSEEEEFAKYLYSRNQNREDLDEELGKLRRIMRKMPVQFTVNAVTYGKYCDFILASRLTTVAGRGAYSHADSYTKLDEVLLSLVQQVTLVQAYGYSLVIELSKRETEFVQAILECIDPKNGYYKSMGSSIISQETRQKILSKEIPELYYVNRIKNEKKIIPIVEVGQRNCVDQLEFLTRKSRLLRHMASELITMDVIEVERQLDKDKGKYVYIKRINEDKLLKLVDRKNRIKAGTDELYESGRRLKNRDFIESALDLKRLMLLIEEHIANIHKTQFTQEHFCKLMGEALGSYQLKDALKKKLLKRMNANPYMIDEAYKRVREIAGKFDEVELDNKYAYFKKEIGNCPLTHYNFVKAMFNEDCLAVSFLMERPNVAIADPGQIVIKQVAFEVVSTTEFLINVEAEQLIKGKLRILEAKRLHGDYGFDKDTVLGLMPLYICPENWQIAKLLMKPCLAWTVCREPLAYAFAQMQTVPFLLLAKVIEVQQMLKYELEETTKQAVAAKTEKEFHDLLHEKNLVLEKLERIKFLVRNVLETCKAIVADTSTARFESPFDQLIMSKYRNYSEPINRTVDVIGNNYAFLAQLLCVIELGSLPKPPEQEYHNFFKRLVEEELRRQTNGWKEEQVEEQFVNKLLNVQMQNIEAPKVVVLESDYRQRYYQAKKGGELTMAVIEQKKQELELRLKKNGNFNEVQKMILIEYKRLYEHKAIQLWYIRFMSYPEKERVSIHKWKCLDLSNSYMIFCLIIQNKTQRKNAVRREAVESGQYVDPFDYAAARVFIEDLFLTLRHKQQQRNLKFVEATHFKSAVSAFALSEDPYEAAGALIGCNLRENITAYYEGLLYEKAPIVVDKMQMLHTGTFKGVRLFEFGWSMSKQKMNALSKIYRRDFLGQYWRF